MKKKLRCLSIYRGACTASCVPCLTFMVFWLHLAFSPGRRHRSAAHSSPPRSRRPGAPELPMVRRFHLLFYPSEVFHSYSTWIFAIFLVERLGAHPARQVALRCLPWGSESTALLFCLVMTVVLLAMRIARSRPSRGFLPASDQRSKPKKPIPEQSASFALWRSLFLFSSWPTQLGGRRYQVLGCAEVGG